MPFTLSEDGGNRSATFVKGFGYAVYYNAVLNDLMVNRAGKSEYDLAYEILTVAARANLDNYADSAEALHTARRFELLAILADLAGKAEFLG